MARLRSIWASCPAGKAPAPRGIEDALAAQLASVREVVFPFDRGMGVVQHIPGPADDNAQELVHASRYLFHQDSLVLGSRKSCFRMMSTPRILAITLNWRQPLVTIECVRSLMAMSPSVTDILVIDNGSGDDSVEMLSQELPGTLLEALPENRGFAGGCNVGLRFALEQGYEYALLINNDAFPAEDMLQRLLAETSPEIGLLSPKIYYEAEPSRIWLANGRQHPLTLDLVNTGRGQLDSGARSANHDVDYLLGTCLLVNLQAVKNVGFLDDNFFMYFEDLDWSIKMRQAGYRLRMVSSAHLYHRVAVSSGGLENPIRRYYLARSGVIFWKRHARLGNPLVILLFRAGSAVKMVARLAVSGQIAVVQAYLRGIIDGWRGV